MLRDATRCIDLALYLAFALHECVYCDCRHSSEMIAGFSELRGVKKTPIQQTALIAALQEDKMPDGGCGCRESSRGFRRVVM